MISQDALLDDFHKNLLGLDAPLPTRSVNSEQNVQFKKRILLTGGAGFIGSVLTRKLVLSYPDYLILVIDKLDYCSSLNNLYPFLSNESIYQYTTGSSQNNVQLSSSTLTPPTITATTSTTTPSATTTTATTTSTSASSGSYTRIESSKSYPNFVFLLADVTDLESVQSAMQEYEIDHVIHLAAQTHVDKSFGESIEFTRNNVLGAHAMLEATRKVFADREKCHNNLGISTEEQPLPNGKNQSSTSRFIYVSTDEVYGAVPLGQPDSKEDSPLGPSNPYSATKAAAEYMVQAYHKSFHLPIIITRSNNVYGPFQYPEKIFPKFIMNMINSEHYHQTKSINTNSLHTTINNNGSNSNINGSNNSLNINGQQNGLIPRLAVLKDTRRGSRHGGLCYIHGSGQHSRTYLYVSDVANALDVILHRGEIGHVYNIGGGYELANIELAQDLIHRMVPPLEDNTSSLLDELSVSTSKVNLGNIDVSKECITQTQEDQQRQQQQQQQSAAESCDDKLYIHESAFSESRQKEAEQHLKRCKLCQSRIAFVEDRAFNDQRYAVNTTKLMKLGWRPTVSFEDGITRTIAWYREYGRMWWGDIHRALYPHSIRQGEEDSATTSAVSSQLPSQSASPLQLPAALPKPSPLGYSPTIETTPYPT